MRAVRECIEGCVEAGVEVLTLFAFSQENWQRPPEEIEALMSLLQEYVVSEAAELKERGARVRMLGELDRLTSAARAAVDTIDPKPPPVPPWPSTSASPTGPAPRSPGPRGCWRRMSGRPLEPEPKSTKRRSPPVSIPRPGPTPIC